MGATVRASQERSDQLQIADGKVGKLDRVRVYRDDKLVGIGRVASWWSESGMVKVRLIGHVESFPASALWRDGGGVP